MNKKEHLLIIPALAGIISVFLPWIDFLVSANGFNFWTGIAAFLCFVAVAGLVILGDIQKISVWKYEVVASVGAFLFALISFANLGSHPITEPAIGVYLTFLSAAAMLGLVFVVKKPEDNFAGGFINFNRVSQQGYTQSPPPPQNYAQPQVQHNAQPQNTNVFKPAVQTHPQMQNNQASSVTTRMDDLDRIYKMKEEGKLTEKEFLFMKQEIVGIADAPEIRTMQVSCSSCNTILTLEDDELNQPVFTCPVCKTINKI